MPSDAVIRPQIVRPPTRGRDVGIARAEPLSQNGGGGRG
jgi:hypothetical protein